ncbi:hypothetical protein Zmor_015161 [Zophobas morio]|uniref:Uncharacterized protein n=1 Tax=Zophobas morio TaxID=2755281 RepID=A0AA38IIL6_9CUCU|nr:hypothetical protein Zmor_015161 [Zophobas morio]
MRRRRRRPPIEIFFGRTPVCCGPRCILDFTPSHGLLLLRSLHLEYPYLLDGVSSPEERLSMCGEDGWLIVGDDALTALAKEEPGSGSRDGCSRQL